MLCNEVVAICAQERHRQEHLLLMSEVKNYCNYQQARAVKENNLMF